MTESEGLVESPPNIQGLSPWQLATQVYPFRHILFIKQGVRLYPVPSKYDRPYILHEQYIRNPLEHC